MYEVTLTGSKTSSAGSVFTSDAVVEVDARPLAPKIMGGLLSFSVFESIPDEPTTTVIGKINLEWVDEDSSPNDLVFTVNRPPAQGSVSNNGVTLLQGGTFTQQDVNNGLVTYTDGRPGLTSSPSDSFDYDVRDETNTTVPSQHFSIGVTLRNDRPVQVASGPLQNVVENGAGTIAGADLQWRDEDNPPATVMFAVVAAPSHGQLILGGSPILANGTFTQADVDAGLLVYKHDGSQTTSDGFSYTVTDGVSTPVAGALTVQITAVDNAPQLKTGQAFDVAAGRDRQITGDLSALAFPAGEIAVLDQDSPVSEIVLKLTNAPTRGRLEKRDGAVATINQNETFTLQDVKDAKIFYVHDGVDLYQDATDAFTVMANDATTPSLAAVVTANIKLRTDGPLPGGDLQAVLPSYIDDAVARDGLARGSFDTLAGESVVLTSSDLNFTDGALGSGPIECTIRYRLAQAPLRGNLKRGATTIVASATFVGAAANQVFTQAEVAGGQIRYLNAAIGDGSNNGTDTSSRLNDSLTFVATDCVLESPAPGTAARVFTIVRQIDPALDLGWVIDSQWTDSGLACRFCHGPSGGNPQWTATDQAGGTVQFCALKQRYTQNKLPDFPATGVGHGGGQVIGVDSFPHQILRQWSAEGFPLPNGTTPCP